jgi:hypothetical protein
MIPEISSLNPAASVIPLVFVLGVTAVKEAFEDVVRDHLPECTCVVCSLTCGSQKRRVEDKKLNKKKAMVYSSATGSFVRSRWRDVRSALARLHCTTSDN